MTSSVRHMRQALPFDVFQKIFNGDIVDLKLFHISKFGEKLSPSHSDTFVQYCDFLFLGERLFLSISIRICQVDFNKIYDRITGPELNLRRNVLALV